MEYEFLDREAFRNWSNSRSEQIGHVLTPLFIGFIIFLGVLDQMEFLALTIVIFFISGFLYSHFLYRKFRTEMVATGNIDFETFDRKAKEYNSPDRNTLHPISILVMIILIFASSWLSFKQKRNTDALKTNGQITIGKIIGFKSYTKTHDAIIEFIVDHKAYDSRLLVQHSSSYTNNYLIDSYYINLHDKKVMVQVGDSLHVRYEKGNPKNNKVIDEAPFNKTDTLP